ncbi:hypothetical protein V8F06_004029 [Rhypophila decipiens]
MSSPGQIADPRARPQSGMPGSYTPYQPDSSSRHTPMKEYGQEYQFAESWANPLPELVVGSGAPPAAAAAAAAVPQADGIQEHTGSDGFGLGSNIKESVWVPPPEQPWYKRVHNKWWIIGGITLVGTIGVIMAILAGTNTFGNRSSSVSPPASSMTPSAMLTASRLPETSSSTTTSTTSVSNPTATSTTSSSQPTSTANPNPNLIKDCSNKDSYHTDIEWMIGVGGSTKFVNTNSAEACCKECFGGGPGCAGWIYDGTNLYTPCTKLMWDGKASGGDDKCPAGYTKPTFTKGGNGIAGVGPCADGAGGD